MFSKVFLAQTYREMVDFLPKKPAYMALRFSSYGAGLSNIPPSLPKNTLLLVDDSTPVSHHNRKVVAQQLEELVSQFSACGVLLDFQGAVTEEATGMVHAILEALTCPVAATEKYAKHFGCPVFLSPPPVNAPLEKHLAPWLKQGVYLEIAAGAAQFVVTKDGCRTVALPPAAALPQADSALHCHYRVEVFPEKAIFTLSRTREDLQLLTQKALDLGVRGAVGLYQELRLV